MEINFSIHFETFLWFDPFFRQCNISLKNITLIAQHISFTSYLPNPKYSLCPTCTYSPSLIYGQNGTKSLPTEHSRMFMACNSFTLTFPAGQGPADPKPPYVARPVPVGSEQNVVSPRFKEIAYLHFMAPLFTLSWHRQEHRVKQLHTSPA
jgi:hypothetical protein